MADAALQWSKDLSVGATGDIALSSGYQLTQERVLRRLLTNPGDYIWQPSYGAGIGRFVGTPLDAEGLESIIRSQLFEESGVALTPAPTVNVQGSDDGTVYVHLLYADAQSDATQVLNFAVSA